jgi:ABC-type branched-subunit amino acid transport system substrate-binding protein
VHLSNRGRLVGSGAVAMLAAAVLAGACGSSNKTTTAALSNAAATTNTTAAAPAGTPIKVMQIATLTGPSNNVPQDADAGKATAKAINAAGGVNGHPIVLEVCDDKFDPNQAADCARQAVSDNVAAVVALNSAFGDKVIPIIAAAGIPSVGDNLLSPAEFTSKNVFPISGGGITGAAAMAYAVAHAGATKIRPVIVDVAAAKGLVPFVQQAAKLFPSATLLSPVYVPAQATDVTSQAAAASGNGADGAFFVVGGGAGATLTRALRTAGFTGTLATSTQSITLQEIKELGPQATGLLLVSAMPPPGYTQNPSVKQFTADMKAGGVSGQLSGGMLLAWASLKVTAEALQKAATMDGAGLTAALNSYGEFDFPGLGKWDYSKPLAAYGGLRIFNPYEYISKVDANGNVIPIDPDPFDISAAPTK